MHIQNYWSDSCPFPDWSRSWTESIIWAKLSDGIGQAWSASWSHNNCESTKEDIINEEEA